MSTTWVVWCGTTEEVDPTLRTALRGRRARGDEVVVLALREAPRGPDPDLPPGPLPRRLPRLLPHLPRRVRYAVAARLLRSEPRVRRALSGEHHTVLGSARAYHGAVRRLAAHTVVARTEFVARIRRQERWDPVDDTLGRLAAGPERSPVQLGSLPGDLERLAGSGELAQGDGRPDPARAARVDQVRTVTRRLVRQHRHEDALAILDLVVPAWRPDPRSGLQAIATHARLSLTGEAPQELVEHATAALDGADAALGTDLARAAELLDVGAGLLLHRDLHVDSPRSPLVESTEEFLSPLHGSAAMALLAAPPPGTAPAPAAGPRRGPGPRRVVVLPGPYPRFAAPLVAALRGHGHHVDVVDLAADHPPFRYLGTDPGLVHLRLRAAAADRSSPGAGRGYDVPEEAWAKVQQADVVVADWADKGAVWASLAAPATTRFVVRAHGVDAMALWVHAVNWSRVDALLSVSPHQAGLVDDVLRFGAVPAGATSWPRCRPVPNVVTLEEPEDPPARDPYALGLVGWGKKVKDPLWALEVLAGLRARGGPWRLVLVGNGFTPGGVRSGRAYADAFHARAAAPDVVGAVEQVPQTDDVAREVARLGFVLSSSIRESFHLGLVEGVLGGAVPVVRDWPFFAGRQGAARLFPEEWVVPDVTAAVDRVWRLRHPEAREAAAQRARAEAARRFDPVRTADELVRVVVGG